MKKNLPVITLALLVVSLAPAFGKRAPTSPSPSASAQPNSGAASGAAAKNKPIPFHGMIASVDGKAKTFAISAKKENGRVFKISDQSVITKAGAPATIKDLVANEEIRGRYWTQADGTLVIDHIRIGPPTAEEKAADQARKKRRAERKAAKAAAAAAAASASPAPSTSPTP